MKNGKLRALALVWEALMIAVISSTATLLVSGRLNRDEGESRRWVTQAEYDTIQRYSRLDEVRRTLLSDYYRPVEEDTLVYRLEKVQHAIGLDLRNFDDTVTFKMMMLLGKGESSRRLRL